MTAKQRLHIAATPFGVISGLRPDSSEGKGYRFSKTLTPSYGTLFPAMVMILTGDSHFRQFGLEVARRCWHNLVIRLGLAWNMPALLDPDKGFMGHGDYYHNPLLWALPAAILGQDLRTCCAPGGLVDRILEAAQL